MIAGFVLYSDGKTAQLASVEEVRAAADRHGSVVWVDVEDPAREEIAELGAIFDLDEEAQEDCLTGEQRPRIDEFDEYVFLVAYGAVGPEPFEEFAPRKVAMFHSERFLISVHREALRTIDTMRRRCEKRPRAVLRQGTDYVLYSILDSMVDNYVLVAEEYAKRVDALEGRSLNSGADSSILSEMLHLREELLELRRVATAQRELMVPLASGELDYISEGLEKRFTHVRDHLATTVDIIDQHREMLHGIRDNYHAELSNRLNEIMKVLTMFASLFLPLSLIAGIYGMNTPLWPDPQNPRTFVEILVLMAVTIVAMLLFFRHKKWL